MDGLSQDNSTAGYNITLWSKK